MGHQKEAFHFRRRKQLFCLHWETSQLPFKSKWRDHVDAFQLTALVRQTANRLPFQPDPFIYVFCWGGGGVFSQITWGIHLVTQCLKAGRRLYLQRAEFSRVIIWWQITGKKKTYFLSARAMVSKLFWLCTSIRKKKKLISPVQVPLFIYKLCAYSSNIRQADCRG